MATTRIMPLHVGKGRTESRAISDIIDYVANPQKTDNGRLIAGFACDSRTVDAEFLLAKRQYIVATGRVRGADDVIAYHVRQSFRPGEITPEEANRLGVEFAKRFTKGNHAFVVCTHIDKSHIHNHIIWSSVSLEYDRKFRNFWGSTKAVRRLSDTICIENGLSIVENAVLGCVVGCAIGLPLSKSLYDFLIAGHFPSAVWQFPIISLGVILLFVSIAAIAAVYAPAKRIRNMSITATINEL